MKNLLALHEATRRRRAKLAVAIFRSDADFDPWRGLIVTVENTLRDTNVPWIDLGPALLNGVSSEGELKVHYAIDGHPNEIGYRLAAEALHRFLAQHELLPPER
jgi:hypothetical protein